MNMHAPIQSFVPAADNGRALRQAFSKFATGVTIVTTMTDNGPVGMTVNSFSSVSLDPPLTLWSIDRGSSRYEAFASARDTAIHVLAQDQEALCLGFAKQADAFSLAKWAQNVDGVPLIEGCLARFECRRYGKHDAGDHTIIVDQILQASVQNGEPLTFFEGTFGGVSQATS